MTVTSRSAITDLMRNSEENKLRAAMASPQDGVNFRNVIESSMKRVGDNKFAFKDHGVIRAYQDVIRGLFTADVIAEAKPSIANLQKFEDFERLTLCVIRCYEQMDLILDTLKNGHKQVEKDCYIKVTKSVLDRMSDSLNSKFYYKLDVFRLIDDIFHEIDQVLSEQQGIRPELDETQKSNAQSNLMAEREKQFKNMKTIECGISKLSELIKMPLSRLMAKSAGDGRDVFDCTSFEDAFRDNIRRALSFGALPQDKYVYFFVNDKKKKPYDFFKVLYLEMQSDLSFVTTQICCFEPSVPAHERERVFLMDFQIEQNPNGILKSSGTPKNNIEVICDDELEFYDMSSKLLVSIYYLIYKQFGLNRVKTDHYSKFDRLIPQVVLAAEQLYDFLAFVRSGYVGVRSDPKVSQNHTILSAVPLDRIPIMQNAPIRYSTHHSMLDIYGTSGSGVGGRLSVPLQQNYFGSADLRGAQTPGEQNQQRVIGSRLQQLLAASNDELSAREEEARRLGLLKYARPLVPGLGEEGDERMERIRGEKAAREEAERVKREERERAERERRETLEKESRERLEREKKDREVRDKERREKEERERAEREERERKAREEREEREREIREKREKERREREEKEKADREERERKDKEEREKKERETRERLEREDRERKEREAKEKLEREQREKEDRERRERLDKERREKEEKDRAEREILEANERALRAQRDKEFREQKEKEEAERAEREIREANERALKRKQEEERLEQEKRDREEKEAQEKAQREADALRLKIEREQEEERRIAMEAAELKKKQEEAEALRLKQAAEEKERQEEAERLRIKKEKELEEERARIEEEALRKRQAQEDLDEITDKAKKVEAEAAEDPIEDDFFDDFDIEDSAPAKKPTNPEKPLAKNTALEFDEPFDKPKGSNKKQESQKDEFFDDFDDLDDFTGSVGKKSAQVQPKKPETVKPVEQKPEQKKDEFDEFDDFDDLGQESVGKKDTTIANTKIEQVNSENPKPVQAVPKKRIAADDEFEFDDDDFDNLLDDEPNKTKPNSEEPKKTSLVEKPATEPSKAEGSESVNPAPLPEKEEIKGGIMALKRLASNKVKEAPAAKPQNSENPRKDPRVIKSSEVSLITEFLSKTQPISEEEIQFVMGNSQMFTIEFIQALFNEYIAQQTVFLLQLEETDTIMATALDHLDNEQEGLAATQDLGRQFNQLLVQTAEELPSSIQDIKFFLAPMQLVEEFQEECLVLAVYDVANKQVMLVSTRPGMTEEFMKQSELALALANTFAQTINVALFGENIPKLAPNQLVVPVISDAFGQFLEESCEDPMLRYTVLTYLMLVEPSTDCLDLEGFKTTLEVMEDYSVENAYRFVSSVRSLDQANKLKPQLEETPELLRPLMMTMQNLKEEKKAGFVVKMADQIIPVDELPKFVAKDVQEMLDMKKEGFEKVFGVLEYCPNDQTTFIYWICLDDSEPNLLIGVTTSKEPINSSIIDTIKTTLAKGGRKELRVLGEHMRTTLMRDLLDYFTYTWAIHVFDFQIPPLEAFRLVAYNDACCVNELMAGFEMDDAGAEEGIDHEQAMIHGEDSLGKEEGQDEQDEFGNMDLDDDDFGAKKAPVEKPSTKPAAGAKSKLTYDQDFDIDDFDDEPAKGAADGAGDFDDLDDLDF